jgi:hypothetical protein
MMVGDVHTPPQPSFRIVLFVSTSRTGAAGPPASVAIHNQFGDEALTAVSARSLWVPSTLP